MAPSAGLRVWIGAQRGTRSAFSMLPVRSWASGRSGTMEPVWRLCATGWCRSQASQAGSRWPLKCRTGRWWMLSWTAALPCMRLIPSSWSACATASAWRGRRTTGATLGSRPADCARTRLCSGPSRPATPPLSRPVEPGDPAVIALREWSRLAEELQHERVRLGNRIRQQLWRYYPQLLEVSDDVTAEWVLDLWTLAPTPAKAARLRETTLARLLQEHLIRRLDAERALGILRQPAIAVAEGVTEAAVLHLRSLVARLRLANREFYQAERKLDELCTNLRDNTSTPKSGGPCDAAVLSSLPGIGPVTLAILLSEAAGPIKRRDYAALRTLSGVAPVTKRSGKTWVVVMRYAAQVRLRQAVFPWARIAVQIDRTCRGRYEALRARGHSYGRALRGVADRLLGVACVLLQRGMLFAPDHGTPTAPQVTAIP